MYTFYLVFAYHKNRLPAEAPKGRRRVSGIELLFADSKPYFRVPVPDFVILSTESKNREEQKMKFRSNKLLGVYRSESYIVQRIEGYLILPARLWWGMYLAVRLLLGYSIGKEKPTNIFLFSVFQVKH